MGNLHPGNFPANHKGERSYSGNFSRTVTQCFNFLPGFMFFSFEGNIFKIIILFASLWFLNGIKV